MTTLKRQVFFKFNIMSKRTEPRNKIDRRLGCNLWGEPKSPFNEESMDQATWLKEKIIRLRSATLQAKLKGYYGNVSEKQFRKYYEKPQEKGDTVST